MGTEVRGTEKVGRALTEFAIPGGIRISCRRESDAVQAYGEVQRYFRHGIDLAPGATIMDIGANIGMFSAVSWHRCRGDADIIAVEPIPANLAALRTNVALLGTDRIRILACGLGAERGSATFAYYPHHSTLSTRYRDASDERELSEQMSRAFVENLAQLPATLRWLRWLPSPLRFRLMRWLVRRSFKDVESIACNIRTVSDILAEYGVQHVDLLKIDVEKAEFEVLKGIADDDWPKLRQVVLEVHDIDGRLRTIVDLLKHHGLLDVVAEQEPALLGSNVYAVYATRGGRLV